MSSFLTTVQRAFAEDARHIQFEDHMDSVIARIIRTHFRHGMMPDDIFRPLHAMVLETFDGSRYLSSLGGWEIPKPVTDQSIPSTPARRDQPTRTGIPTLDRKLDELERDQAPSIDEIFTGDHSPKEVQEIPVQKQGLYMVPIDQILAPTQTLRQSIDDDYLRELTETVTTQGILQPITVRTRSDGTFEVVAGHQRLLAARNAGLSDIPCIVRSLLDHEAFQIGVTENLQRKDLTDYEVARLIQRALTEFPRQYPDQQTVAATFGKTPKWVSQHLAILEFVDQIPARELHTLSHTQAAELRTLPPDVLTETLETQGIPSTREIIDLKQKAQSPPPKTEKYVCEFCGPRLTYQLRFDERTGQYYCTTCNRLVAVNTVDNETTIDDIVSVFPYDAPPDEDSVNAETLSRIRTPTDPFPERLKVTASKAEHQLFQYLQQAYTEGRLQHRPFLNNDRRVFYIVRRSIPDIGFDGLESPVYLHGEAAHKNQEQWDDDVEAALERQEIPFLVFRYAGSGLSQTKLEEFGEATIRHVNRISGGDQ